jgi:hypothetical protein
VRPLGRDKPARAAWASARECARVLPSTETGYQELMTLGLYRKLNRLDPPNHERDGRCRGEG